MADTAPPAAQSKDTASMGYPVATVTPVTPPTTAPVANKRPKTALYGTAIGFAIVGLIAQALFMNSKLILRYYPSYYAPTYTYPTSSYPTSSYTPSSYYGHRHLASAVPLPPTSRKLLGKKKSSSGKSKTKYPKYGGSGGASSTYNYSWVIKGKDVAKAPGMVIATAVLALLAATALLVLLLVPRLAAVAGSQWAVIAEAAVAALMLILWLVSMAVSAKTASNLREIKSIAPKMWLAGNAIALVCSLLNMFVWGALLAFAVMALLKLLRARKDAAPAAAAAPAAPAKDVSESPAMVHNSAYSAGGPAPQQAAYPAPPAGGPAAPDYAGYPAGAPPPQQAAYHAAPAGAPYATPNAAYPAPPNAAYPEAAYPAAPNTGYPEAAYPAAPGVYAAGPYTGQPAAAPAGVYPPPAQHGA